MLGPPTAAGPVKAVVESEGQQGQGGLRAQQRPGASGGAARPGGSWVSCRSSDRNMSSVTALCKVNQISWSHG